MRQSNIGSAKANSRSQAGAHPVGATPNVTSCVDTETYTGKAVRLVAD